MFVNNSDDDVFGFEGNSGIGYEENNNKIEDFIIEDNLPDNTELKNKFKILSYLSNLSCEKTETKDKQCEICNFNCINVIIEPCYHLLFCSYCLYIHMKEHNCCPHPYCRTEIKDIKKIYGK